MVHNLEELLQIAVVENVTLFDLPLRDQLVGGGLVDSVHTQVAHAELVAFGDVEFVRDGRGGVVERGDGFHVSDQIAFGPIEFLNRLKIVLKLYGVRRLTWFQVNQSLELVGREGRESRPADISDVVLSSWLYRKTDINDRARTVGNDLCLGIGKLGFQISATEVHRKKIKLFVRSHSRAEVFLAGDWLCGGL